MTLVTKIKDKKVNFEFNKEYIKVVTDKIASNDAVFISSAFKEMHPADAADIIEHLSPFFLSRGPLSSKSQQKNLLGEFHLKM